MSKLSQLTEDELVDQVNLSAQTQFQAPYLLDMERRMIVAIRDFNAASARQATIMIVLTVVIAVLTVAILIFTAIMAARP
jgi:hypothetical protein